MTVEFPYSPYFPTIKHQAKISGVTFLMTKSPPSAVGDCIHCHRNSSHFSMNPTSSLCSVRFQPSGTFTRRSFYGTIPAGLANPAEVSSNMLPGCTPHKR
jgi:hypothetical protein